MSATSIRTYLLGSQLTCLVQEGQVAKVVCIIEVDEEAFDPSEVLTSESPDASPATGAPIPQEERFALGTRPVFPGVSEPQIASGRRPVAHRLHPLDPNYIPSSESTVSGFGSATSVKAKGVRVLALPAFHNFARKWEKWTRRARGYRTLPYE
jgi:hypothetical protein